MKKPVLIKKISTVLLVLLISAMSCVPTFADSRINTNAEEFDWMSEGQNINPTVYGVDYNYLTVTPVQQCNGYYCGPACACMAAQALGLGTFAQGTMASYIGTTTAGSSSEGIKNGLNGRLSAAGSSLRYRHALTSSYNLLNCIKTSIDKGAPVIVNVKVIPNRYSVQSGHFILVIGYWINSLPVSSTGDVSMQAEPNSSQTIVLRYIDPHYDDTKFGIFEISYADLLSACNSGEGTYGHFVYVY